jgi:hypothetical protein
VSEIKKTVVFYTKDAGLTSAEAARMEEAGFLCVKVKDPTKITAPALDTNSWVPINDQMALLAWKAMCSSSTARGTFGEMVVKAMNQKIEATRSE